MNADLEKLPLLSRAIQPLVEEMMTKMTTIAGDTDTEEEAAYKVLVTFFFSKGWKTVNSIFLLCSKRFAEDAAILARSLLESAVNLLYIAKSPVERSRLFNEYDVVQKQRGVDALMRKRDDPYCAKILESLGPDELGKLSKEFERVRDNYPRKDSWSGKSLEQMVNDVPLGFHNYDWVYRFLCRLAHPNPDSMRHYVQDNGQGELTIGELSSDEAIKRIIVTICIYFMMIVDVVNAVFKLGVDDRISEVQRLLS